MNSSTIWLRTGMQDSDSDSTSLWVVAKFDHRGTEDDELSFKEGDTIKVVQQRCQAGWGQGELYGKIGWFPGSFVARLADSSAEEALSWSKGYEGPLIVSCCSNSVVRALHDYDGQDASELTLKKGDKIKLVERHESGWWSGSLLSNGKEGWFPKTFVELARTNASDIALPVGETLFLQCGQTRVEGKNETGNQVKFDVEFLPRSLSLLCSDPSVPLYVLNWRKGLKLFFEPDAPPHSSDPVPWLPLDVLVVIFRQCPGSRAALSLVCREFRRVVATMKPDSETMSWTTRDEIDSLEGAFRLLRAAPWFIGPQIVGQAEELLERVHCSQIAILCVLDSVRTTDLNQQTESERKLVLEYRAEAQKSSGIIKLMKEPDRCMKEAWSFLGRTVEVMAEQRNELNDEDDTGSYSEEEGENSKKNRFKKLLRVVTRRE